MANNYTQWSEFFPLNSSEEAAWIKSVLCLNIDNYQTDDSLSESEARQIILKNEFGINISTDDADFFPGFSVEFSDNDSGVYIYAEEFGNVDTAASIFQTFLKKFRPSDYFKIEWADTCSKPRAGEFGGGAVFVTADNVEWTHTGTWISERAKKHLSV